MKNKILFFSLVFLLLAEPLYACSVCFGDPNSKMSQAIGPAILLLGVVIVSILIWIGTLSIMWTRRAKKLYGEIES